MRNIWCTKAINNSVEIISDVNDTMLIMVDGEEEMIIVPEGEYYTNYNKHVSVFIDAINREFEDGEIPVVAKLGGIFGDEEKLRKNVVVLEHKNAEGSIILTGGTIESVLF